MSSHDIRRGHQVLAHLMKVNTGLGGAVRRMHDHEAEHGHLPADQLRTLAGLLYEVAVEVHEYAAHLDQPVIQVGNGRP